jgi:hypothetical protein
MASIFIQLASYHDFELPKTIFDCIEKSSKKHSLTFGVHHCYYDTPQVFIPKLDNVKVIESKAPENIGVGNARSVANTLYNGEDYYLQIDSHTRFLNGWDESLINLVLEFQKCGVKKPLISAYPGGYSYNDNLEDTTDYPPAVTYISFKEKPEQFEQTLIPSQLATDPEGKQVQSSISAGFIFTLGSFAELGFNEKVMFWGEEILIAARSYTHGFDLLIPDRQYIYHLYYDPNAVFQKNLRRHVWQDFSQEFYDKDALAKREVLDIFTSNRVGPGALGVERTLKQYGDFAGLDFEARKLIEN